MLPSPPTTAAANTDKMERNPVSGSMVVSRPISIPPKPARPMPTKLTSLLIMSALIPLMLASIGLSATARIALPVRVNARKQNSMTMAAAATARFCTCCGPTRIDPKRQSRSIGNAYPRSSLPKAKRTMFSSAMVSAIEAMAVVMKPAGRNCFSTTSSVATPTAPATRNANPTDGRIGRPSLTLAM